MTEVCLDVSRGHFAPAAGQPAQQVQVQRAQAVANPPPRCAVHSNETFVATGTSRADLDALFGSREP